MRKITTTAALACLAAASIDAHAGDNPMDAKFQFDAGWFFLSTDTRVRVNGETTQIEGSDIDFESTFGVEDENRFRLEGMWRMGKKHALHLMYFDNKRSGTRTLDRDVTFGDTTYPVTTTVTAKSSFTVAELTYDYAFVQNDKFEFAAGGGLHMLDVGLDLSGTIAGGGGSASGAVSQSASTKAPLPLVGGRVLWRINDKFYANAQIQYFYIGFDNYKGTLSDLKGQLTWQVMPHFGLGIGYDSFRFNFKVNGDRNFDGRLRVGYGGAMVFATATF